MAKVSKRIAMPPKITRPSASGIVPRKRLFKSIDWILKKSHLWVFSPAGSGKTSLISSYIEHKKLPAVWYQMDKSDADPATFFYYLGMAASGLNPRNKKPMPLLTPEYASDMAAFARGFFSEFFSRLDPPCAIVLDNYHDIPEASPLQDIIKQFMKSAAKGVSIIIISRMRPPAGFAPVRANGNLGLIGWEDMKLLPEESRAIMKIHGAKYTSPDAVSNINKTAGGWAAGLVLMLAGPVEGRLSRASTGRFDPSEVFDYFASEIFNGLDIEIKDFLMKTSILPDMTPDMAQRLTGNHGADPLLKKLHEKNYFTEKRPGPNDVYQYHPLFREFLSTRLISHSPGDDLINLRRAGAGLLQESNRIEDAALLYSASNDHESLSMLIIAHAKGFLTQGRNNMVEKWLNALPREMLNANPMLLYLLGVCRMPFNPLEARGHLEKAINGFQSGQETTGMLLSWSGIIDSYIYEWNDFTPMDGWLDWFNKTIGRRPELPPQAEANVVSAMIGGLMFRRPDDPDMKWWIDRAEAMYDAKMEISLRTPIALYVSNYYTWIGDQTKSLLGVSEMNAMASEKRAPDMAVMAAGFLNAGMKVWFMADADEAIKAASGALQSAKETGVHIWDDMLSAIIIYGALLKADYRMARAYLEGMKANLIPLRGHGYCQYYYLEAWLAHLLGETGNAAKYASKALDVALKTGYVFPIALCRHESARILHKSGDAAGAGDLLDMAMQTAVSSHSSLLEFSFLLSKAEFAFKEGKDAEGRALLEKALSIGREHGHKITLWWWEPESMSFLMSKALQYGIETEYAKDFIQRAKLLPPEDSKGIDDWPYPVKIYTLGRFGVLIGGSPLEFGAKAQRKPLDMLKVLVALGGRGVREDAICDALWQDADGDAAHSAFTTTLQRLRKLLKMDDALDVKDGCLSLSHELCWVDTWEFDKAVADGGDQTQLFKVFDLYKGEFLPGDDGYRVVSSRERFRNMFIRAALKSAGALEKQGRLGEAVDFYQRAIDADALREEPYQRLMLCYLALGFRAEAVRTYASCSAALSEGLGVGPSQKTTNIYKSVTSD